MSGPYGTPDVYEAVVVGAGPAGITVVGNLLEQKVEPILWIDDAFNGGRINYAYREVPSNTKVGLFIDYATSVGAFRRIVSGTPSRSRHEEPSESDGVSISGKPDKLQALRSMDATKGCQLSHAADMMLMLTQGLKRTPGVITQQGRLADATLDESTNRWNVKLNNPTQNETDIASVDAKRIVLCTGSSPNNQPLPVEIASLHVMDLDCVLSPTLLATSLSPMGPTEIAVIGASHSAILCLMNLYHLASNSKPDLKIKWLTRHPLRYAEFMDGWILRDNTGLKGAAATWAKENLEPETMPNSDVAKYITKVDYKAGAEKETMLEHLQNTDFYVQAIGYSRDPIPTLKTTGGKAITPYYDHEKGNFNYVVESADGKAGDLTRLPGLFGAGIAFPERVKDPHGNVEYAVGFMKFMKYIKKVVPGWV
jgi:hypothetical protein